MKGFKTNKVLKILLLGDPQSGKTTIFHHLFFMEQEPIYRPTLEPKFRTLTIDKSFSMTVWDMPGNRDLYDLQGAVWIQETDIAIIIYSIIDKESIFGIQFYFNLLLRENLNIPILIVANKIDLMDTPLGFERLLIEGKNFAKEVQRVRKLVSPPLIEGSATNSKFGFRVINKALKLYEEQRRAEKNLNNDSFSGVPITSEEKMFDQKITRLQRNFEELNEELINKKIKFSKDDIRKIKDYIENDRISRESMSTFDRKSLIKTFEFTANEPSWLDNKKNFSYIVLYSEFIKMIQDYVSVVKANEYAKLITEYFLSQPESLDRFRALEEDLRIVILNNLVNNRITISNLGDQIYIKYREKIYQSM